MTFLNLPSYLEALKKENDLVVVDTEVDPHLEIAEIHRRVILEEGPALLFTKVKGSSHSVATNLFGTKKRVDLAFGKDPKDFISEIAKLPEEILPPSFKKLWSKRSLFFKLLNVGLKFDSSSDFEIQPDVNLESLPVITSWPEDGGPFFTLPLVYTEHPETGLHNLGMYRLQRFDRTSTGLHMQIGKGGGFHWARASELGKSLPVNVFLGGPPALMLSAIAPLPENVPELMLASLVLNKKLRLSKTSLSPLPIIKECEFALLGESPTNQMRPEGPFGDHYGYYSLQHDFPVFNCKTVLKKKNAIYPATVVGKPRQEDFYIGDYLQELLSPLFPLVMPAVRDLWSYGETGYHSLAAAVVKQRYKREAMVSAFRILGEGQLSLTKFLLLVDKPMDLRNFPKVLEYVLSRADFRTDLYVFSNLSMDTLDYTGPMLNEGSKGVLLGMGEIRRELPKEFNASLPTGITCAKVFCPGCLVISGQGISAEEISTNSSFRNWPLVILADSAADSVSSTAKFLWTVFTRFEPAADIYANRTTLNRFHPSLEPPILIDARMKANYPAELFCDEQTKTLVDTRWKHYRI